MLNASGCFRCSGNRIIYFNFYLASAFKRTLPTSPYISVIYNVLRTHTHARTHLHTHTHTHARTHTHTHTRTHARTHYNTHARTHARTHAHARDGVVLSNCPLILQRKVHAFITSHPLSIGSEHLRAPGRVWKAGARAARLNRCSHGHMYNYVDLWV